MTTHTTTEESLREEFHRLFPLAGTDEQDFDGNIVRDEIADFWLQKRREEMAGLEKKVENLREEVMPTHAEENGYGCAIDDVLSIIRTNHIEK